MAAEPEALEPLLARYRRPVLDALRAAVAAHPAPPFDLLPYHLGWADREGRPAESPGGKLLRPTLCLLACEAAGGAWRDALPAAAALELLHNFTLVHDDVEDASEERHGRATLWRVTGEAQAINAGDGLFALAHATLLSLDAPAERVLAAARMLDDATLALCEGQHRDLTAGDGGEHSRAGYLAMVDGKSCALLAASTGIGALVGGADEATVAALREYGRRLGFAFQVRDDILGIWGDPEVTGKPASDDLRAGKRTFPVVVALERAGAAGRDELLALLDRDDADLARARELLERAGARDESERAAAEHAGRAVEALAGLPLDAGRRAELVLLARFAADRSA